MKVRIKLTFGDNKYIYQCYKEKINLEYVENLNHESFSYKAHISNTITFWHFTLGTYIHFAYILPMYCSLLNWHTHTTKIKNGRIKQFFLNILN